MSDMFDVDLTMRDDQQERIQDIMWNDQQGMDLILHKVDQQERI